MPTPPPNSAIAPGGAACAVVFGAPATAVQPGSDEMAVLALALPVLHGGDAEPLLAGADALTTRHACRLAETDERFAGFTLAAAGLELEAATLAAYRRIFAAAAGRPLYRIWNYVPRINAPEGGLENYRRFCRARSRAFEEHFGRDFQARLPAASAVGVARGPLALAFVGGEATPRHFENPQQVPAFAYPPAYGPRPPSFSRATLASDGPRRELFISGTAAIRGHATVAAHDLAAQLACTRENLLTIAATAGAGADFGARDGWQRTFKVYVRRAADFPRVRRDLETHLLRPGDRVTCLQADLCRGDLLVEIEAVLTKD